MKPTLGGALSVAALAAGYWSYGWRGLVLALTVIAFWLLLQFSRSLRVLRGAAQSPLGHVDNAVMFNAKLDAGLRLPEVIALTRSLGRKVIADGGADASAAEVFAWRDGGGDEVELTFVDGRCTQWQLRRHSAAAITAGGGASP